MDEQYPSLSARIQSIFIDSVLIIVLMFFFSYILDYIPGAPDWSRIIIFLGVFIFYEPFCLTYYCTLGNYLKGIRVRKFDNTNERIDIFHAFIRYFLKICLGWISFLTVHFNPSKRAIHDLGSGSVMVNFSKSLNN